ncbi:MAG: lipopolysaccharide biosynthesis protein [Aureliella sp.]
MSSWSVEQSEGRRGAWFGARIGRWLGPLVTLCASLGTFGFFAVQGILLARLLGPEMRGGFAAAVLFPQTLLYLGLLGAPELFAGYAARGADDSRLRRSAARYGFCAGMVMLGVCLLLDVLFIRDQFRWVLPLACLCAISLPLQQIRLAVQAVDHGQRQWNRYNQGRLLAAAAFPAALVVAFVFGLTDLRSICVLFVVSQAAALLLAQRGMRQSWRGSGEVPVGGALKEARPLIAAWFASELLERLDMCLMLALVSDEATLGYYAAATPIAALMIIVPNAASLYAFNRGARADEIPAYRTVWQCLVAGVAIQAVSAVALGALLPWLVYLFYGPKFAPTVVFAWLLLPAGVFRGLLQAIDGYLRARGKAGVSVKMRLISTAILIIVSVGLSPWLGQWGLPAAYSIPIGLSVALGFCFVAMSIAMLADVAGHHARNADASQGDDVKAA